MTKRRIQFKVKLLGCWCYSCRRNKTNPPNLRILARQHTKDGFKGIIKVSASPEVAAQYFLEGKAIAIDG